MNVLINRNFAHSYQYGLRKQCKTLIYDVYPKLIVTDQLPHWSQIDHTSKLWYFPTHFKYFFYSKTKLNPVNNLLKFVNKFTLNLVFFLSLTRYL
jgi:hypothetical protein